MIPLIGNFDRLMHSSSTVGEREFISVGSVLKENFVGYGPKAKLLEDAFCLRTGKKFGFAVSSGFHAISLALRALDLPPDSLVSIPALTCASIPAAIKGAGHRVSLADIQLHDLTINPESINQNSQAIIAPHAYGAPLDIEALEALQLPWIEDCATSPATIVRNRPAGSWGTIAVFSLNSTKYITAGTGGLVLTDDADIARRIESLLNLGEPSDSLLWKNGRATGVPGYLSDINAAIALTQFEDMPCFMERRIEIAEIYNNRLSGISGLVLPTEIRGHSYYRYIMRTQKPSEKVASYLVSQGVDARTSVNPWLDSMEENQNGDRGDLANANAWKEHLLSLPIHPSITDEQANFVADCLTEIMN